MNTHKRFWLVKSCWLAIAATLLLISGCATLNIEQPKVSVTRLAPASSGSSLGTLFEIDLKIANPNGVALPIKGMSYSLAINGAELLFGTSNQIPTIPAYGSETVTLQVEANLLSAPKLFLALNKSKTLDYTFKTKIDLSGPLPTINVVESGTL
ncbi:LEA type 2 family protein [Saccharophagus degradans]|uniref:LEA type 2 family protein n=2 Tax=Saccharophagus degradans TaxID=86304 RepID=A0AAW7X2K8_9GAMM|nr:LEA type 2 family protein [Saccharophagus degradans]ABD80836.1 putative lipoprotein [Saccharophagus degradans 2-40]MBU2987173.1 LEA type 2 family protein [Saccharophagus degradans]MDO6421754.1 LEA type 2 family protein [Saccharophagus degradans]MDO6606552.1 LEA type 2 family protein [Saccharophagus degradans]